MSYRSVDGEVVSSVFDVLLVGIVVVCVILLVSWWRGPEMPR